MRIVSNEVSESFTKLIETYNVTPGEYMVIRTLYETEYERPSEVADFIGFTRGAISKQVDKLVKKGLISRTVHETDRRSQQIKLTKKGLSIAPDLIGNAGKIDEQYFSFLSKKDRDTLKQTLHKIADHHKIEGLPTK